MTEDAELLRRYAEERSDAAFAELVQRHLDLVYSAALRRLGGDAHAAADVAQQVFAALAQQAAALARGAVLPGWLYATTRNVAVDFIRTEKRRRTREQEAHTMHEITSPPPSDAAWDQMRPMLDAVMDGLSDADREIVVLRYFARRPFADIGATLRLSEDAARMRVDRALEKLRALLARRGVTSTTAALGVALSNQGLVAAPAGLATMIVGVAATGEMATAVERFFMNTTNLITGTVALVAICATVYQFNQTHRIETDLAALARDRDGLRAQLRDAHQNVAQRDQQVGSLQRELETARAPKPTPRTVTISGVAAATAGNTTFNGILSFKGVDGRTESRVLPGDVAGRRALMAEAVGSNYPALFRQLGWTAAQREQFTNLMCDWKERTSELIGAAVAQGANPADSAGRATLNAISDQTKAELQTAFQGAFGDAGAEAIRHYDATASMRNVADKLATALFYTDTPLAPTQADQLVEIMANNARVAPDKFSLTKMDSEAVFAQVSGVLSAPQVAALRQLEAQRLQQEIAAKALAERNSAAKVPVASKAPGS